MGKWIGNGVNNSGEGGTIINNIGWEPQWVLVKNTDLASEPWMLMDSMRGIPGYPAGGGDQVLYPNYDNAEATVSNIDLTATGFTCVNSDDKINGSGHSYIYMAIRRPDAVVGKPPSAGTGVFTMDGSGSGSSTIPAFDSNFPVDFALNRDPAGTHDWQTGARLLASKYVRTNDTNAASTNGALVWDSNVGYGRYASMGSADQAWMWKRGQGFDVVAYHGDPKGVLPDKGTPVPHSLNAVPEMIWTKGRNSTCNWSVYHKGLNGGTNPEQYYLELDVAGVEATATNRWNDTAPTSTHFFVGDNSDTGSTSDYYIAMLFASANDVDGNPISKVGYYTGNGSATERTITLGFQPRFLILKNADGYNDWFVFDTVRGWASGNDTTLSLNSDSAQYSGEDYGAPTSNGFTLTSSLSNVNGNNEVYIYYAHA